MKNCLLVLAAGVMLCVPPGCERGVEEDPAAYDRDVDGPPVVIRTPMPDYDVIGKPGVVRRRREVLAGGDDVSSGDEASGGGEDPTGPSAPASDDEIAEVKVVIEKVIATKDSGDDSAAMAFFSEEAATAIQEITQGTKDIQAKSLALHSLMETKFGAQYPDSIKENNKKRQTEAMGPSSPAEIMGEVSMEQLIFTKIGEKIVATGPKNNKFIFSKTAEGWKIGFDKNAREMLGVLRELLKGTTKMLDTMTAGINDDSITPDNVEAKAAELTTQLIAPVQKKLMAIMMKAMAGAGDGAAPADGGAAPADGGAAPADGGAAPADGGAAPADGGAAPADGGAAPADGGAAPADGGAAPADGAAATRPAGGGL